MRPAMVQRKNNLKKTYLTDVIWELNDLLATALAYQPTHGSGPSVLELGTQTHVFKLKWNEIYFSNESKSELYTFPQNFCNYIPKHQFYFPI